MTPHDRRTRWAVAFEAWRRRVLPEPATLAGNRWLRWLGPALHHPRLWHMSRRGIALGAAIGVFFGFLIPVAQIPVSAVVAVALRANLPTAVASTLVTNPITFAPVYYAAWKVGAVVLGETDTPPPAAAEMRTPPAAAEMRTPPAAADMGSPPSAADPGAPPAAAGAATPPAPASAATASWFERTLASVGNVGKPLLVGLALFACGFGLLVYLLVHLLWRLQVHIKRRRRRRALAR